MGLKNKDLLGLRNITCEEIMSVLETAKVMKKVLESNNKKTPHLQGKSIVTLFYENSTRTRLSFELAAKFMSANASSISASASSVAKGGTLIDTGKTIDAMGTDVVIIRHPMSGAPHLLAQNIKACVINAGDGMNEHPTQALLDMYTMWEKKKDLSKLKVAIIGDILHSRVARSNIWGLAKMGADVSVFAPPTLMPKDIGDVGVRVCKKIEDALDCADVVMGLRIQMERQKKGLFPSTKEYASYFGINGSLLKLAKDDCLLMHPGPVNRGLELTTQVIDGENSVINEQVTNGVAVRMALLYLLTRREHV